MAQPASVQYRLAYQRHRAGGASGSVGEAPEDETTSKDSFGSALLLEALNNGGSGGVFGETEMYASERGFHELLKWRLAYQSHRSGSSRGAKGEMGAGLTVADVRMFPVAQLAMHQRAKRLRLTSLREASSKELESAVAELPRLRPTHVHVGAGRLGLGLVLPALARTSKESSGRLVILQRPSDAWASLVEGSEVQFTVNQELVCTLRVVRSATKEQIGTWQQQPPDAGLDGLLVLSEEEALLDELAATATSLSTSLGPALGSGLAPLLSALVRVGVSAEAGALRLYAAENDHAAVQKLAETPQLLGGLEGLPIETIPLLVDRVCTARTISAGRVDTSAEPWQGEIVVMTPPDVTARRDGAPPAVDGAPGLSPEVLLQRQRLLAAPPFSGAGVRWPQSEAEAHFLHRRKILTVNGTHTTLAFHTLAVHEPPPHAGLPVGDYELLRAIAAEGAADEAPDDAAMDAALQVEETHRMAWAWAVARQLLLLFDSDEVVARSALGCDHVDGAEAEKALVDALLAGARVAIGRLGRGGDMTKRILGGGVVNRFQTRLKPIASFLDESTSSGSNKWLRGSLPRTMLRRAKLTETAMRLAVLGLTADAERFTVDSKAAEVATPKPTPQPSPAAKTQTPANADAPKLPQSVAS